MRLRIGGRGKEGRATSPELTHSGTRSLLSKLGCVFRNWCLPGFAHLCAVDSGFTPHDSPPPPRHVSGIASQWCPWASLKKSRDRFVGGEAAPTWSSSRRRGRSSAFLFLTWREQRSFHWHRMVLARRGWFSLPRRSLQFGQRKTTVFCHFSERRRTQAVGRCLFSLKYL